MDIFLEIIGFMKSFALILLYEFLPGLAYWDFAFITANFSKQTPFKAQLSELTIAPSTQQICQYRSSLDTGRNSIY